LVWPLVAKPKLQKPKRRKLPRLPQHLHQLLKLLRTLPVPLYQPLVLLVPLQPTLLKMLLQKQLTLLKTPLAKQLTLLKTPLVSQLTLLKMLLLSRLMPLKPLLSLQKHRRSNFFSLQ
jgi:hypothetical protein